MNSVELIKKICKEHKIPISRLERDLGYGNGYIGQLRKGSLPSDRAVEIANYLKIDLQYLLSGGEDAYLKEHIKEIEPINNKGDITNAIDQLLFELDEKRGEVSYRGKPIDDRQAAILRNALEIAFESLEAKKKN